MTSRVSWRGALLPAIVALASYILFRLFTSEPRPRGSAFDFGFDVNKVMNLNIETASRSWEVGAAAEALLELHNPDLTVYTRTPFPAGKLPRSHDMTTVRALRYIRPAIWTNGSAMLTEGEGSSSDPASLGVPALLLSAHDRIYLEAATRQAHHLLHNATRFGAGPNLARDLSAISHRDSPPQLWGDFVYMVPPFLAYYGVASNNLAYLEEGVRQCELYRNVLVTDVDLPNGLKCHGLWRHIVSDPATLGPDVCCTDSGVWLTSNAWAMAGMVRVLATVVKWAPHPDKVDRVKFWKFRKEAQTSLLNMIDEMLNCTISQTRDPQTNLLRNYLDVPTASSTGYAFGDVAGTALMTSALYRLAVLRPAIFATETYLSWADDNYRSVAQLVDDEGRAGPVTTPYEVPGKKSLDMSPEGQSMVVMMAASRRDCVMDGTCRGLIKAQVA